MPLWAATILFAVCTAAAGCLFSASLRVKYRNGLLTAGTLLLFVGIGSLVYLFTAVLLLSNVA